VEKEFFRHMRPTSLLQRFAEPAEVAQPGRVPGQPLGLGDQRPPRRVDGGVVRAIV